jgi:hypothetical protein
MIVRQKSKGKRELLNLQSSINYGNVPYKKKKKEKKKQILDCFKPSKNSKKPSGINFRRFFLDDLKPSRI